MLQNGIKYFYIPDDKKDLFTTRFAGIGGMNVSAVIKSSNNLTFRKSS
jgi:hypothetical protein